MQRLERVLKGSAAISTDTAMRLARACNTTPHYWLNMQTKGGRDFLARNPKGYSPVIEMDDGTILAENHVILACIAEKRDKPLPDDRMLRGQTSRRSPSCLAKSTEPIPRS